MLGSGGLVAVVTGPLMLFAPLNVRHSCISRKELRGPAVGLLARLRNEDGSVETVTI